MKDVIRLVESKKITLTYRFRNSMAQLQLFYMEEYGYCVFQKNVIDAEYENAKDAVKKFYELKNKHK